MLEYKELFPNAKFRLPPSLEYREFPPIATLSTPVVMENIDLLPIAMLLPAPPSVPFPPFPASCVMWLLLPTNLRSCSCGAPSAIFTHLLSVVL